MFDLDALARADDRLAALGAVCLRPAAPRPVAQAAPARTGDPSRCPHLAALAEAPREPERATA